MSVVSQSNDFPSQYEELRTLRARHSEAVAEARAIAISSPSRPSSRIDLSHNIRATINRLASSHNVVIRALRRESETQLPTPHRQAKTTCVLLPIRLSSAWRDYLLFRAALGKQVAKRAALITREVIKPLKARRVAVNLTIRACFRAPQAHDEAAS